MLQMTNMQMFLQEIGGKRHEHLEQLMCCLVDDLQGKVVLMRIKAPWKSKVSLR